MIGAALQGFSAWKPHQSLSFKIGMSAFIGVTLSTFIGGFACCHPREDFREVKHACRAIAVAT